MNSTDKAYRRDKFLLQIIDSECMSLPAANPSDYDEAIEEYRMLLDDAIFRNNEAEIKELRREIQQARAEKRIIKRMIETNQSEKELAYT